MWGVCAYSVAQLCLTLCDPMDCSPPGSSVHGGLSFPTLGDLSHPGIKPESLASPELAGGFLPLFLLGSPYMCGSYFHYWTHSDLTLFLFSIIHNNNKKDHS